MQTTRPKAPSKSGLTLLTQDEHNSVSQLLSKVDKDGDGTLDEYELHSVLVANGILVPIDVVLSLFHEADRDSDGSLSLEEFGQFILSPASDKFRRSDLLKSIRFDIDWWVNVMYFVAGILYTVGGFPDTFSLSGVQVRNIFLSGSILYLVGGQISFFRTPINKYKAEKSFEKSSKKLLEALRKNAAAYDKALPREEGAGVSDQAGDLSHDVVTKEDPIDIYIREVIFAERKTLTKTDLGLLLLKYIGAYDDAILVRMLAMVDDDGDGTIDVDEFQYCVKRIDITEFTLRNRLAKVASGLIVDYDWLLLLTFVTGSIVGVTNSFLKISGSDGIWVNDNFTPSMYVMYAYNVGMIYFVTERVTSLRASYTMRETVRSMLRSWMEKFEEDTSKEWVDCDKRKFNRILEEQAVFIPKFQVDALFQDIDADENHLIVKSELQAFVNIKRKKFATIFKTVVTDIFFWANWFWFIGCVLYLVALFDDGQSATQVSRRCQDFDLCCLFECLIYSYFVRKQLILVGWNRFLIGRGERDCILPSRKGRTIGIRGKCSPCAHCSSAPSTRPAPRSFRRMNPVLHCFVHPIF